ncbi:MAG: carbohydrate-binding domain-containing protein [Acidobacteriota bacterium]
MKRTLALAAVSCLLCLSCSGGGSANDPDPGGTSAEPATTIDAAPFAVSVAAEADPPPHHHDPADIVANNAFDNAVDIDFTANTAKLPADPADPATQTITPEGVTPLAGVSVAQTAYGVTITSTAAGVRYNLAGSLSGTLVVNSSSQYQLCLDGVAIDAAQGPALDLESSKKVFIVSPAGTANTLTDQATSGTMDKKGALYGKGAMIFSGDGTTTVTGNYKHGIYSKDYIRICGGTLNVTVNAKNAVQTVNGFIFDDGDLTVNARGETLGDESKGIRVEGLEGAAGAGKGYIVVNGGRINVTSVGKAITAGWDIDEDETVTPGDPSDNPDPDVIINNGVIDVTTTGTPEPDDINGDGLTLSPEGIEAKSDLVINSGYIVVNATEDGLNAGDSITIGGGYVYLKSQSGDASDSNGSTKISGGVVVAIGQSGAVEGSFDSEPGHPFAITGGILVGIAANTSEPTASACTQNAVVTGRLTAERTMALKADAGTVAFAFFVPRSFETMIISSPLISVGTAYTVYTGGTATGDNVFGGLYLGNLGYSGGTAGTAFTASSGVTRIGGTFF